MEVLLVLLKKSFYKTNIHIFRNRLFRSKCKKIAFVLCQLQPASP